MKYKILLIIIPLVCLFIIYSVSGVLASAHLQDCADIITTSDSMNMSKLIEAEVCMKDLGESWYNKIVTFQLISLWGEER